MIDEVQTLGFFRSAGTNLHEASQYFDDESGHHHSHDDTRDDAGDLGNHLGRVAIEQAIGSGIVDGLRAEDAGHEGSPYAAHAVAAKGVEGVIVAEFRFHFGDEEIAETGRGEADDESSGGIHETSARCNTHKTGQDTGHKTEGSHFLMGNLFDDDPYETGGAGGDACIGQGLGHHVVGHEAGAGIKSEPSKPEEAAAQADIGNVMRTEGQETVTLSLADENGCGEGGEAGSHMNNGAAGVIQGAHVPDETAYAPHHMAHGVIDQGAPEEDEQAVRREAGPFHDAAAHDGGGQDGKGHLEHGEENMGNGFRIVRICCHAHMFKERPVQVLDDAAHIGAKGKRVAVDEPLHCENGQAHHGHHDGIDCILAANEAAVEKGQGRSHNEHQQGSNGHIGYIGSVQFTFTICRQGQGRQETGPQKRGNRKFFHRNHPLLRNKKAAGNTVFRKAAPSPFLYEVMTGKGFLGLFPKMQFHSMDKIVYLTPFRDTRNAPVTPPKKRESLRISAKALLPFLNLYRLL